MEKNYTAATSENNLLCIVSEKGVEETTEMNPWLQMNDGADDKTRQEPNTFPPAPHYN